MNTIKKLINVSVPAWLFVLVVILHTLMMNIDTDIQQVDPVKVTTITLTGEGGESIFSFRIQESDSEDEEAGQD
jgi:hypothetical protein